MKLSLQKFFSAKKYLQAGFSLILFQETYKLAGWLLREKKAEIINIVEGKIPENTEEFVEEIAEAFENLPKEKKAISSQRIMFGVSDLWFAGEKIAEEKLDLLKSIAKRLSLSPIAYVSLPEAIDHILRIKEGIPLTAVLIGVGKESAEISLMKIGKPLATKKIILGEGFERETEEFLKQSEKGDILPSRILVFGDPSAAEKITERITRHRWSADVSFLHLPRVERLPEDIECQSVSSAGAVALTASIGKEKETVENEESGEMIAPGFILQKDILEEKSKLWISIFRFSEIKPFFLTFFSFAKKAKFLLAAAIALVVVLVAGFSFYNFFSRATIKLYLETKKMEQEEEVKVDPLIEEINIAAKLIPGARIQAEEQGRKKTIATGKKKVGDPAKGEVMIYNDTEQKKSFPAGTVITAPTGMAFVLDSEATVASKSGTAADPPGKAKASVTAKIVGSEGNLAAGVEFTVAGLPKSEFVAKNETAFSGGTSREVNIVSGLDRKRLLASLSAELKEEAKAAILTKISSSQRFVDDSFKTATIGEIYDKEIGEEAAEIGLDLKIKATVIAVEEGDLKKIITEKIDTVPSGYSLKSQEIVALSLVSTDKAGILTLRVNIVSVLLPTQDSEEIRKSLAGRSILIAESYLRNLAGVSDFEISLWPPAKFFQKMPARNENIRLEIMERK